uniref:Uncharacterized protein n=1 Tax=viral metagenome TaxID=1070528 RepID=A0A6C0I597_9ZZZZ
MICMGDVHVYTYLDDNLDKLFSIKYETVKKEGHTTYININFTHKSECVFYDYNLVGDVLKLSFVHDGIIKCADILLIYV